MGISTPCCMTIPMFRDSQVDYQVVWFNSVIELYNYFGDNFNSIFEELDIRIGTTISIPRPIYIGGVILSEQRLSANDLRLTVRQVKDSIFKQFKAGLVHIEDTKAEAVYHNDTAMSDAVVTALINMYYNNDSVDIMLNLKTKGY